MNLGENGVIANRNGRIGVSTAVPCRGVDEKILMLSPLIAYVSLIESLASSKIRKLVLFENFNQKYLKCFARPNPLDDIKPIRTPSSAICRMISRANHLESLSASFMIDAVDLFNTDKPSEEWPNLTSLIVTSHVLSPDRRQEDITNLLKAAASAALLMPKLETMEIWNGREGLAALFKFELARNGQSSKLTWRGTWAFPIQPAVVESWEAVSLNCRGSRVEILTESLSADDIKSHGDAIHYLKLSERVIRPVSLHQIWIEHNAIMKHHVPLLLEWHVG